MGSGSFNPARLIGAFHKISPLSTGVSLHHVIIKRNENLQFFKRTQVPTFVKPLSSVEA